MTGRHTLPMRKILLLLLAGVLCLWGGGCGRKSTVIPSQSTIPLVTTNNSDGYIDSDSDSKHGTAAKNATPERSDNQGEQGLVIESQNSLPDQSASQMLDEVDKQLNQLTEVMNQLEGVNEAELDYGGN